MRLFLCLLAGLATPVKAENQLRDHPSPYLALHGNDPVHWRDWNEETVSIARESDKLLFLSVGYFSCHWCHVMQRESYQNPDVANLLNQHFVSVKIDRELESALDERLIAFAERTLGSGGWPLNVFITPDGYPVFAVLYMPATNFSQLTQRLQELWTTQKERILGLARQVNQTVLDPPLANVDPAEIEQLIVTLTDQALSFHDDFQGGFGNQNKFPHAPQLLHLLELFQQSKSESLARLLTVSLDAMAAEGLWDHVGGGFFRYVVDPGWQTPHFEKMLYDNAMLAEVYLKADSLFPGRGYGETAHKTLAFMQREMLTTQGALISSFSAVDDNNVEGGYYLWSDEELKSVLTDEEYRIVRVGCDAIGTPALDGHHLRCSGSLQHVAGNLGIDESVADVLQERALRKLFERRNTRVLPADTKLLAGWNGLALSAFSKAAADSTQAVYSATARSIRDYLINDLWNGRELVRARHNAQKLGNVALEDYALVARGLFDFADFTGDSDDYAVAKKVLETGMQVFWQGTGFRMEIDGLLAPAPARDITTDSPLPAPTAVMGHLLNQLGSRTGNGTYREQAREILNRGLTRQTENAFFYASHIMALKSLVQAY